MHVTYTYYIAFLKTCIHVFRDEHLVAKYPEALRPQSPDIRPSVILHSFVYAPMCVYIYSCPTRISCNRLHRVDPVRKWPKTNGVVTQEIWNDNIQISFTMYITHHCFSLYQPSNLFSHHFARNHYWFHTSKLGNAFRNRWSRQNNE